MGLEVGDLICDQAVAVGVALVEGVVSELLDDAEQFLTERTPVAGLLATADETVAFLLHHLANLLATGLAEVVGLCKRVARELLGHPHHGLLVDHQAVGVSQDLLGVRVDVGNCLPTVLAVCVVVVHIGSHRTRPVEADKGGHVVEAGRRKRAHQRTHRPRFQLEHAD